MPATNAITFADLLVTAAELGAEAGKVKDTQVKFLLKAVEGGYHNAVDLSSNKHGTDVDDATKLAEAYVKSQNATAVFDAKAPNQPQAGLHHPHWHQPVLVAQGIGKWRAFSHREHLNDKEAEAEAEPGYSQKA